MTARLLPFHFQTQATPNWCGPSATRMVLSVLLPSVPEQRELAVRLGAAHPDGTDKCEGTDEIDLVVAALNGYLGAVRYAVRRVVPPVGDSVVQLLRADLVRGIDEGCPLVANVVSGWRPDGYPEGRKVRHYVAVVGYADGGATVVIADPAYGLEGWRLPAPTYEMPTAGLAAWMASKGYAARTEEGL